MKGAIDLATIFGWICAVAGTLGLLAAVLEKALPKRALLATTITATVGLWLPWIVYGCCIATRISLNQINYLEREPIVVPREPDVVDLNAKGK